MTTQPGEFPLPRNSEVRNLWSRDSRSTDRNIAITSGLVALSVRELHGSKVVMREALRSQDAFASVHPNEAARPE